MIDLALLQPIALVAKDRIAALTGWDAAILFAALSAIENEWDWSNSGLPLTDGEWDGLTDTISNLQRSLMANSMIGSIWPCLSGIVPAGCLVCDGATYDAEDYPELHAILADVYKTETTFTLPDLQQRFIMGASLSIPIGSVGGEENHTLTIEEMPVHQHTYTAPVLGDLDFEDVGIPQPAAAINPIPQNTGTAGGGQGHNNLPPFHSVYFYVVAQ